MTSDKDKNAGQTAIGHGIAQADRGGNAVVNITLKSPPAPTAATAPAPPPHFVGRRSTINYFKDLLRRGESVPIFALQGMGGIGKTTIAQQIAVELANEFPGGVFWGSLPDHDGNADSILRMWGNICGYDLEVASSSGDIERHAVLIRGLLTQRMEDCGPLIIILDDVRSDWIKAAKIIDKARPNEVVALVTTRDERLAAALSAEIHQLDVLPTEDGVNLLEVHAGKRVIQAEPDAVQKLLETVGYLPLGIELAGKQLKISPQKTGKIVRKLYNSISERALDILELPGHQGLVATFSITYENIPSDTQKIFRWLAAFAIGPMKTTHIAGVVDITKEKAESILDSLVHVALLSRDENQQGIYRIHPLIRQYSTHLLKSSGEEALVRRRHLKYYHRRKITEIANYRLAANYAIEIVTTQSIEDLPYTIPSSGSPRMYCVKCRNKQNPIISCIVEMKNGKPATMGTCICGTHMFKIGG